MTALASTDISSVPAVASVQTGVGVRQTIVWALLAVAAFYLAYLSAMTSFLIAIYPFALVRLSFANSWRKAFYAGLLAGLLIAAGKLDFFWRIFSAGAFALWVVYAFWIGLFTVSARACLLRFGSKWQVLILPMLWCGLEYFRSELYYLRFSWLTPGLGFGTNPALAPFSHLGAYGIGFLLMFVGCAAALLWVKSKTRALLALIAGIALLRFWGWIAQPKLDASPAVQVRVAGVQMEFPTENEVRIRLNELNRRHPDAELLVLSEYTFTEPIPGMIKAWCREHRRYLIVGGEQPVSKTSFYNEAVVISPDGEIVFRQTKSVPIQFFKDGLPAPEQRVWNSPWGKIGICICYDLSYTRVTDRLIQLGAQTLIVPTMDVADWGQRQHELHARIAPVRAAEYSVPIFRLASSGISQAVDATGRVVASGPYPGDGAMIAANLALGGSGRRPIDRWLAPIAAIVTPIVLIGVAARASLGKRRPNLLNPTC